ncbi:type I restriction endonuclease, partial [Staphylococcus aureus]|uniref:type I restriction endonuclease n=1 Tax=Staphylococcus aureus TaxID=1280 RepID=UPI0034D46866
MAEVVDADVAAEDLLCLLLANANRDVYRLLRNGVKVKVASAGNDDDGDVTVHVIDWNTPANNDFFVAQQLWVQGEIY